MAAASQRLGDVLVNRGLLTRPALEASAARANGKLGHYLRACDMLSGLELAESLAEHYRIPFVALGRIPPDRSLFQPRDLHHYLAHHYVPFAKASDGLIVATSEPSAELRDLLRQYYHCPIRLVATGPRDLTGYFASTGATASTRRARLSLRRKYPHLTADRTLIPDQQYGLAFGGLLLLTALIAAPETSWLALLLASNLFYLLSLYMKFSLLCHGRAALRAQREDAPALAAEVVSLRADDLPIYTVLVPLYRESPRTCTQLIHHLSALDYPAEKLDIKLICEADDHATLATIKSLRPPERMEIIAVPPSRPRTKPKACNVALQHIRGEYLVIYDAEDAPEPDQLKRAIAMFRRTGQRLACVQASLNYANREENLLTRLFSIEYSSLFRLCLPALERMHMPIPLGGTSNHLRVSALLEAGGWDAFNVTEDADLGMRLAYLGYATRVLTSTTYEEAPITVSAWLHQRTRWIKGYIQTWLVYMRDPARLKRRLGSHSYFGFQFFIGAPVMAFLIAPFFWLVFLLSFTGVMENPLSPLAQSLCVLALLLGIGMNLAFAAAVIRLEGWRNMGLAALAYPFYWLLHSIAAARALGQLAVNPHYWNKTRHGVSQMLHPNLTPRAQPLMSRA